MRGSTLGSPIKVFMSGLDEVENFRGGNDPQPHVAKFRNVVLDLPVLNPPRTQTPFEQVGASAFAASRL